MESATSFSSFLTFHSATMSTTTTTTSEDPPCQCSTKARNERLRKDCAKFAKKVGKGLLIFPKGVISCFVISCRDQHVYTYEGDPDILTCKCELHTEWRIAKQKRDDCMARYLKRREDERELREQEQLEWEKAAKPHEEEDELFYDADGTQI